MDQPIKELASMRHANFTIIRKDLILNPRTPNFFLTKAFSLKDPIEPLK